MFEGGIFASPMPSPSNNTTTATAIKKEKKKKNERTGKGGNSPDCLERRKEIAPSYERLSSSKL